MPPTSIPLPTPMYANVSLESEMSNIKFKKFSEFWSDRLPVEAEEPCPAKEE